MIAALKIRSTKYTFRKMGEWVLSRAMTASDENVFERVEVEAHQLVGLRVERPSYSRERYLAFEVSVLS